MQGPRRLRLFLKRLATGSAGRGRDGALVVGRLGLRSGMRVADVGAGFGAFSVRFAAEVGATGRVFAVDVDPDLREEVDRIARGRGLSQLVTILATPDDPALPEPVDLVFLSSSFHHLPDPGAWFARLEGSLRPGALVVILEPRPTLLTGWYGHATRPEQVVATMVGAGYRRAWRDDVVRFSSLQAFELAAIDAG